MNVRRAAALGVVLAAAIVTLVLLRGGGHSNPAVAHVGGQSITRDQLAEVADHFRVEARREGKPFPDENSARFRTLRNRLLGVLVYRTELSQAAARLGVRVTPTQVEELTRAVRGRVLERLRRDGVEFHYPGGATPPGQ